MPEEGESMSARRNRFTCKAGGCYNFIRLNVLEMSCCSVHIKSIK